MRSKLLIWMLVLMSLIVSVIAAQYVPGTYTDLIYYPLNETAGTTAEDFSGNNRDATFTGGEGTEWQVGLWGNDAVFEDRGNEYLQVSYTWGGTGSNSGFFNSTYSANDQGIWGQVDKNYWCNLKTTGKVKCQSHAGAQYDLETTDTFYNNGSMFFLCDSYEAGTYTMRTFLNGRSIENKTESGAAGGLGTATRYLGYSRNDGDTGNIGFLGNIEDYLLTSTVLTFNQCQARASQIYIPPPPPPGDYLNMSIITYPTNNTQYNSGTLNLNTTVNSTYIFNCSLYINDTLNQTNTGYSAGNEVAVDFDLSFAAGTVESYNYNFTCFNNGSTETSIAKIFYIDRIEPLITADNISLNTTYVIGYDNLSAQINYTDTFAYFFNVSIDGTLYYNLTDVPSSPYIYNLSLNASGYSNGVHTLSTTFCDGHTDKDIVIDSVWKDILNKKLVYDGTSIYHIDKDKITAIDTEFKGDRYDFTFEFVDVPKDKETFVVESIHPIQIVKDKRYKGHLVILEEQKWIDFEGYGDVTIKRIKDNMVEVTVSGMKNKISKFNSIGNLNCLTREYKWLKANATRPYDTFGLEKEPVVLYMNVTHNTSFIGDITASLNFNNTWYAANVDNTSSLYNFSTLIYMPNLTVTDYINYSWSYIVDGKTYNTTEAQINIYNTGIDNCSSFNMKTINFTFINYSTGKQMAAEMDVWLQYTNSFGAFNYSASYSLVSNTSSFCISPNWTSFIGDFWIEYSSPGFDTFSYYSDNTNLSNSTKDVLLYLTGGTSNVTYTVRDYDDNVLSDVYISLLPFDVGTATYKTAEVIKTDSNGVAIGHPVANDVWYKYVLVYQGVKRLETSPEKVTYSSKTFTIGTSDDYFDQYNTYNGMSTSLRYYNSTKTFVYNWNDPSLTMDYGCLRVVRRGFTGDILVNDTCLQTPTGSITQQIGDHNGTFTFIGTGYLKFDDVVITDVNTTSFDTKWQQTGNNGLLISFMFIVALIMIGVWNPIVALVLLGIGVIFSTMSGIFHLDWEALMAFIALLGIAIYKMGRER